MLAARKRERKRQIVRPTLIGDHSKNTRNALPRINSEGSAHEQPALVCEQKMGKGVIVVMVASDARIREYSHQCVPGEDGPVGSTATTVLPLNVTSNHAAAGQWAKTGKSTSFKTRRQTSPLGLTDAVAYSCARGDKRQRKLHDVEARRCITRKIDRHLGRRRCKECAWVDVAAEGGAQSHVEGFANTKRVKRNTPDDWLLEVVLKSILVHASEVCDAESGAAT